MLWTGYYHKNSDDPQCEDRDFDAEEDEREREADWRISEEVDSE